MIPYESLPLTYSHNPPRLLDRAYLGGTEYGLVIGADCAAVYVLRAGVVRVGHQEKRYPEDFREGYLPS